jgi:hypothetical protein
MKLTNKGLEKKFIEYNNLYFNGRLGKCTLKTTYCKDRYGQCLIGKTNSIKITNQVNWTDESLRDCLLHEMIHLYIFSILGINRDGFFNHGRHFRREVRRIKRNFGIHVSIRCYGYPPIKGKPSHKLCERALAWLIDR